MLGDIYREELTRAGEARQAALEQAEAELRRVAQLLPGATEAGLAVTEIARLADLSRPTVYQLLRDSGAEPDLSAAALAALVDSPHTASELSETLGLSRSALDSLIHGLVEADWAEALKPAEPGSAVAFAATDAGEQALIDWEFPEEVDERTTKTLRVAVDVLRFSPEDRRVVNRKIAHARAQGRERLGLLEAMRMGVEAELRDRRKRSRKGES